MYGPAVSISDTTTSTLDIALMNAACVKDLGLHLGIMIGQPVDYEDNLDIASSSATMTVKEKKLVNLWIFPDVVEIGNGNFLVLFGDCSW